MALPPKLAHAAPMVLLVVLTLARGLFWIAAQPPLAVTDEPAHFDDIQYRVEVGGAPPFDPLKPLERVLQPGASTELHRYFSGVTVPFFYKTDDDARATKLGAELEALALERNNRVTDGQDPALKYPGGYYWLTMPAYLALRQHSIVARLHAIRLVSVLLGLVAVLATYFAAQLVVADRRLCFVAGAFVALQPMECQMTAAVNNDAGVIAFASLVFYLQLRTLRMMRERTPWRELAGLGLLSLALVLTKPTGYGILPTVAAVACACAYVRRADPRMRRATQAAAGLLVVVLLGALVYRAKVAALLPGDASVPGAIGAPNFLVFLQRINAEYWEYLLRSAWGQFGWLEFSLQGDWMDRLRSAFFVIEVGTIVGVATWSLRELERPFWFDGPLWLFSIAVTVVGVGFILFVEHRFRLTGIYGVIQGRNFLYVLPAFAVWAVIAIAATVPARMRGASAAIVFSGALALQVAALFTVMVHHYV